MARLAGFEGPIDTPQPEPQPVLSQPGLQPRNGPTVATTIPWFPQMPQHLSECSWHPARGSLFCLHGWGLAEIASEENVTVI